MIHGQRAEPGRQSKFTVGNTPAGISSLAVLTIASVPVFLWSASWNLRIGENASDTGGSGGNAAAWLWFLGSFMLGIVALVSLIIISGRRRRCLLAEIQP
jgi:hypothetical protein